MKITLLSNCGLMVEDEGQFVLIDVINSHLPPFYELPVSEFEKMCAGIESYQKPFAAAFTHLHPDHYDAEKYDLLARNKRISGSFQPSAMTAEHGIIEDFGGFRLEYQKIVHTPLPPDLMCPHFVLLLSKNGKSIYVTGDAAPETDVHRAFLHERKADCAFWNGQYLSHSETRALLHDAASQNYIYHIPVDEKDSSGIRRKAEKNMQRFSDDLQDTILLEKYPSVIEL